MPARLSVRLEKSSAKVALALSSIALGLVGCGGLVSGAGNPTTNNPPPGATLSIATSSIPSAAEGIAYSASLQATGGTAPYSWSLSSGSLPLGLNLTASTGTISGTPTAPGSFTFTAKVVDSVGSTAAQPLSIAVAASALSITGTSLPNGATNTAFDAFLDATGGVPPYNWAVASGALASGLTLSPSGEISGVPTSVGTFPFGVKVTDNASPANGATRNFSITIAQGAAHSVGLTWTASPSAGVAGYNIYRSTVSGSGYLRVNSTPIPGLSYTDGTVLDTTTYYYVMTAVDNVGDESGYSTELKMAIP